MPILQFSKYEGLANDFIVVDGSAHWVTAAAARRLCDRRRGIGADGVLTLLPPRTSRASHRMHVFNADGSVAEMCGNGLRCVVRHVLEKTGADRVAFDTDAGVREGSWAIDRDRTDDRGADDRGMRGARIRVTLGRASLIAARVEAHAPDVSFVGTAISMGNPHLVLDPVAPHTNLRALAEKYGPGFESHPQFPARVNVGFTVHEADRVRLIVYERGSGITHACGTGAAAAAVVALRAGVGGPRVEVVLPGGALDVEVDGDVTSNTVDATLGLVTITGDARRIYTGEVELAASELQPTKRPTESD